MRKQPILNILAITVFGFIVTLGLSTDISRAKVEEPEAATVHVIYDDASQLVSGVSTYSVGFADGQFYNPKVISRLYNQSTGQTLNSGSGMGYHWYTPAQVNHPETYAVRGDTYCVSAYFYLVKSSIYRPGERTEGADPDEIYVGSAEECAIIPIATPTPTPTPTPCDGLSSGSNAVSCACCSPTVQIQEVGFTGDRKIRKLGVAGNPYIDEPDGTTATWRSNNNPNFPVAYLKGASPTLFAKFSITPNLTTSQSAQIRVKRGNTVVTASPISVSLIGSEVRVPDISIPFSNLETAQFVRKNKYEFKWQISFDNAVNWINLDGTTKHDIHWLNSNPADETTFSPFVDSRDIPYNGLFDKALEWSTGKIDKNEPDIQKIIQKINAKVAEKIVYEPGRKPIQDNPLKILDGEQNEEAVCADNALILSGLLKSIGLSGVQINYHWGGDSGAKRNYYCKPDGCGTVDNDHPIGARKSMQVKREQLGCNEFRECVSGFPTFTYHATVIYGGQSFDPSYGKVEGAIELLTALNVPLAGLPQCVHNAAATALRVSRDSFGNDSLLANNDPQKICYPVPYFLLSGSKSFRFDGLGGADTAIVSGSTGQWVIQDEFESLTTLPSLGFTPTQDALAPGDYDGDGLTDPGVWYSNGDFFYLMSSNYYKQNGFYWRVKSSDEKAVPGDYDGDNISDIASWRPSDGKWTIHRSSNNVDVEIQWGLGSLGDVPVPGDYDGDGITDIAIWRASTGEWWIRKSSDLSTVVVNLGMSGDIAVQGDYDGDGTTDYAVVRPSTGVWYFLESENGYQFRSYQGPVLTNDDTPVPADYNADSKTDVAVWFKSSGMWYIVDSQTGEIRQEFLGQPGDTPVMSASVFR